MALVMAHVELAKTEASEIGLELARFVGLIVGAIALVIAAISLVLLGGTLFLGEWLFGSMGWGVLHGLLAFVAIAIACVLAAVYVRLSRLVLAFAAAVAIGAAVALLLGLEVPNKLYTAIGDASGMAIEPGVRPLVVGLMVGAVVGLVLGILVAWRTSVGAVAGIIGGIVLGLLVGAFTAITFGPQVGAALGVTAFWLSAIVIMVADAARTGIDVSVLQQKFVPQQSIDTGKETLEWLQQRMPPGLG